ncbi:MAG: hypothetical protein KAH10_01080 [Flavobacteriales bacterium]|nr:hypothetical protein [Flavobacteriales bacterium]
MKNIIISFALLMFFASCNNESKNSSKTKPNIELNEKVKLKKLDASKINYAKQSIDDELAKNISNYLLNDILKDDISSMAQLDRKFQFFKIDLNDDGKDEIFVRFMSPYFCGTGGCTFLLLDYQLKLITRFSVTRAPIFVERTKVNKWSILLVKDNGVFKELSYANGTYPDNPSLLKKAPYDAPSANAFVMFDDDLGRAKTYPF